MWSKVVDDWKTPAEYIDREAANLALAEQGFDWDKVKQALASVPAADVVPSPDWISADEELPPNGQEVLCWYEYFRYGLYNRMYQTFGIGHQFNGNWDGEVAQGRNARVLAWMPLPEPPEMDGGADNAAD